VISNTNSSQYALNVNGDIKASGSITTLGIVYINRQTLTSDFDYCSLYLNNPGINALGIRDSTGTGNWRIGTTNQGAVQNHPDLDPTTLFFNRGNANVLTLTTSGRIGINIAAPQHALDVNGSINASAYINASSNISASNNMYAVNYIASSNIAANTISLSDTPTNSVSISLTSGVQNTILYTASGGCNWFTCTVPNAAGPWPTSGVATTSFIIAAKGSQTTMLATIDGFIGINKNAPTVALDVVGTIRATTDIILTSDERIKTNIESITNPLTKIEEMRGIYFTLRADPSSIRKVGVIAQEMEKVLPEVVHTDSSSEGMKAVSYGNITAILIEGMKELSSTVKGLQAEINRLNSSSITI